MWFVQTKQLLNKLIQLIERVGQLDTVQYTVCEIYLYIPLYIYTLYMLYTYIVYCTYTYIVHKVSPEQQQQLLNF